MRLSEVPQRTKVKVVAIEDPTTRRNLRTMGVSEGTVLLCLKRLNRGPLVVRTGGVTLALGRELAGRIEVTNGLNGPNGHEEGGRHRARRRKGHRHGNRHSDGGGDGHGNRERRGHGHRRGHGKGHGNRSTDPNGTSPGS